MINGDNDDEAQMRLMMATKTVETVKLCAYFWRLNFPEIFLYVIWLRLVYNWCHYFSPFYVNTYENQSLMFKFIVAKHHEFLLQVSHSLLMSNTV